MLNFSWITHLMKEGLPAGEDCTAAADKVFVLVFIIISCIIGIRMFVW
jgi:hypothetical protein